MRMEIAKDGKHAYMIMAHNDFKILKEILVELDHERNDIFLHIDLKVKDYPMMELKNNVKKACLHFVPRMNVNWGGYSQIACEIHLMGEALKKGHHAYYHLLTGATVPLQPQENIFEFFDAHEGIEFIGFENENDYSGRVRYFNVFNEIGKADNRGKEFKAFIRNKFRGIQKKVHYCYGPAKGINFKKGFVYWSLTEDAIKYAYQKRDEIERIYKHSFCGDELFIQTLLYNSDFRERIYDLNNEYRGCLRYVKPVQSWNPEFSGSSTFQTQMAENGITVDEIDKVYKSKRLFGWKFVGDEGIRAINRLRELHQEEILK